MPPAAVGVSRACCVVAPKKRLTICLIMLVFVIFTAFIFTTASSRLSGEQLMEETIMGMKSHLDFLESQYRERQEDVLALQNKVLTGSGNDTPHHPTNHGVSTATISPDVMALLKKITGTRAAAGVYPKMPQQLRIPFVLQLLPHLMSDPFALRPSYHMHDSRNFVEIVVGVPTVKRDKESYLMITLTHLIQGLTEADRNTTLIVVMVGETDLEHVINTARQIEISFQKEVESGLIEVISPSSSYYPDLETIPITLGDSPKRVRWRTKQNMDALYLMAYAQSKGTFYLMLEDDVVAKAHFIQTIKKFTAATTINNPGWFFIEFCHVGGIGKLFRSADLIHFMTYIQLFYYNMPIDWLLESYLADKMCTIEKTSKTCAEQKAKIRPKYKTSLFQHIGLYSSLKGKIQKVKDNRFGTVTTFYPRHNPPLEAIRSNLVEHYQHSLKHAYEGKSFFWGVNPKKGDLVEFWFRKPTVIERYTFRSGNAEHVSDIFYETLVEVQAANSNENFTTVGSFDEFGLAEGKIKKEFGPLSAIRLRVEKNSTYWVILSEIQLKPAAQNGMA